VLTYPEFPVESDWDATLAEWLAGLFLAPLTVDAVTSYRDGLGAVLLEELEHQPGCYDGARLMQVGLTGPQTSRALARQLSTAFMELFEGVGGPRTVSPFESAHGSPAGRLFQAPAIEMDRLLSQTSLMLTSGIGEPADHLSVELALLAHMLRERAKWRITVSLLDQRLLNWVPGFAQAVQAADRTGFYAGLALLLVGFLQAQRRAIDGGSQAAAPRLWLLDRENEDRQ
jgi:TorA-specific chaperone